MSDTVVKVEMGKEQLDALLHVAFVQALGDKGREAIITAAVKHLTTAPQSTYGNSQSPLVDMLGHAARDVARKHLEEKLASDPEFIGEVERLYTDAFKRVFGADKREQTVTALADAMMKALTERRY